MLVAGKLKSHGAAERRIMPRPGNVGTRLDNRAKKYFPHGEAANVLFRLQDQDTGGAFRSARNQTLPTLAGVNGKPWLNNHVRGK